METGRHQSIHDSTLKRSVEWISHQDGVAKVIIGVFNPCSHKTPAGTIAIRKRVDVGFQCLGYAGDGILEFVIGVNVAARDIIAQKIERKWPSVKRSGKAKPGQPKHPGHSKAKPESTRVWCVIGAGDKVLVFRSLDEAAAEAKKHEGAKVLDGRMK